MYRSFMVRMWRDDDVTGDAGWQAEVQHIQSGQSWHFNSRDELLACLRQWSDDDGPPGQSRDQSFGS